MAEETSPRGRLITLVIFGTLLLLGVLLLWFYMSSDAETPEQPDPTTPTEDVRQTRAAPQHRLAQRV